MATVANIRSPELDDLATLIARIPGVERPVGRGASDDGRWWVKFAIELESPVAWRVVQEFGYVLNYLSINERLPTIFFPVSPPPYLNGGPAEFLSWVIESTHEDFTPAQCLEQLETRLPSPIEDEATWAIEEDDQ